MKHPRIWNHAPIGGPPPFPVRNEPRDDDDPENGIVIPHPPTRREPKARGDADPRGYRVQALDDGAAEIYIYDEIDPFWGIGARQVVDDLKRLGRQQTITVRINSPGGDVFEGLTIYNALVRNSASVQVTVDGAAMSSASVIAMAGETIAIAENAFFMIHNPWTMAIGNAAELREIAETLDTVRGSLAKIYSDRTGVPLEEIEAMLDGDSKSDGTWLTSDEAVRLGFADEITENLKVAARFDPSRFRGVPDRFKSRVDENRARAGNVRKRMATMQRYLTGGNSAG